MSVLIDSGELGEENESMEGKFFAPIGPYYDHDMVKVQFLKDENGNLITIRSSEVKEPSTMGFLFSIIRKGSTYCLHKETVTNKITIKEWVEKEPQPNQVGPTLFLPTEQLIGLTKGAKSFCCRVGRYDDGRHVLFLHDSNHESNYPVRIPSE